MPPATSGGQQPDGQRDARAVQHAGEDVAPEIVGAEPVLRRRRRAAVGEIERVGRVARRPAVRARQR